MNPDKPKERRRFPTFLELVVVLITVALLAALLAPKITHYRAASNIAQAKTDIATIIVAISTYQANYGRLPISSNATDSSDFTFGTFGTSDEALGITNASGYQANNSEVMAILLDLGQLPDGRATANSGHSRNPQQISFITTKMADHTNSPGVGPDYIFRDPWGHPYIITIDLNGDNKCRDAFYRLASVSETSSALRSHAYLTRPSPPPYSSDDARDSFEVPNARVIVWSLGPDGKADNTQKASEGVNKDNITSW